MTRTGKCVNFDYCDVADRSEAIEIAPGGDPKCPECGKALQMGLGGGGSNLARLSNSPALRVVALGLLGAALLGGTGYAAWRYVATPNCEIADAKKLLTLDPKAGELEDMGESCLEAGMAEADADKIVTGTVLLRGALDRKSPDAAWLLGQLFDPLKRAELEERSRVPTLLPAVDAREALRFYDRAGSEQADAAAAAAALRSKFPELRLTAAGKNGAPLGLPGYQGLLQRVLTKPGAMLANQPGGSGGRPVAPFSLFYVFESRQGWLKVGDQLAGGATGWLPADQAQEWNVMLVLRYAPPAGRQPALFFRDELAVKSLLTRPGASEELASLVASAQGASPDPRLVAVEDRTIDWSASPYLMPILRTSPVVTDSGRKVFLAQIGSVAGPSQAAASGTGVGSSGASGGTCRSGSPETAMHQIVFAIDTTNSMGPYIDGVRRIAAHWSQEVERRGLTDKVRFGVVAYRNNMDEEPQRSRLEYVTKTVLPLSRTSTAGAFAVAMQNIRPAVVSTHSFAEDAVAGLDDALRLDWSQGCGLRMVFLITDAGSLKSDDPKAKLPGTGLTTLAAAAKEQGISIFPVHVLTREARSAGDTEKAAAQYRGELTDGRGISLYRAIPDGSPRGFDVYLSQVGVLLNAIENEAQGKLVDRSQVVTPAAGQDGVAASVQSLVLGKLFSVQQRFVGAAAGATAPTFTSSWTSDRDLANPDVAAFDVSIYLTRRQLGQLAEKCQSLVNNARQAQTESGRFFELLRMLSAATAQDPDRFTTGSADLSALMPSFLGLLPYKSDVLALTAQDWRAMGATKQDAFIRRLSEKVAFYRRVEADQSRWIQLSGSDASDQVALIPLKEMP
jgi:hypothetical protein